MGIYETILILLIFKNSSNGFYLFYKI